MSTKERMSEIVQITGQAEAHRLIMHAYDTELICNRLGRLEQQLPMGKLAREKRNLLEMAIERVHAVVTYGS